MPSASNVLSIAELRQVLEERFPETALPPERHWETGWAALDAQGGGIRRGAVTELSGAACGAALFMDRMLAAVEWRRAFAALVDCGRSFDPGSYGGCSPERLLCVFCESAEQGVKAADLLLRDGNLPLVLLDLQAVPPRALDRIPASTWHRFQRLVENSGAALVVLTPQPVVEAARVRIAVRGHWDLGALHRRRRELIAELDVQIFQRGRRATFTPQPLASIA
jgi:hypothetical protein